MASKKTTRPVLRSTTPDVAAALDALDAPPDAPKPPVVSTPIRAAKTTPPPTPTTVAKPSRKTVPAKPPPRTANLSVSIASELRERIDAVAYEGKLGRTSIVEGALLLLFDKRSNAEIKAVLEKRDLAFKRRADPKNQ